MAYIVNKYVYKDGKKFGPYKALVMSVRIGKKVIQKHLKYIGK